MTNDDLIQSFITAGVLRTSRIIDAFRRVDRKYFVPASVIDEAYANIPLPLAEGQTISQPLTVAVMLELLQPQPKDHCLDIGAGSGWTAALLGEVVGPRGRVTAIERLPRLVAQAKHNLAHFQQPQVKLMVGDASGGWPANAPYDIIHVAAAIDALPATLKEQLADHGRLIAPIGVGVQDLAFIRKISDNSYTEQRYPSFQFVPLIMPAQTTRK